MLIIPFSSAARNATSTLLLFTLLGISQPYLASLLVLVITLFPLTYPWVVVTPWVLARILLGGWLYAATDPKGDIYQPSTAGEA